jgi:hypothetical protein
MSQVDPTNQSAGDTGSEETGRTYQDPETGETLIPRSRIRSIEKRANEAAQHEQVAIAARRELAFVKAGINTDTPAGRMFEKAYDGDLTAEAITAAFTEIVGGNSTASAPAGGTPQSEPQPGTPPPPSADDLSSEQERAALATPGYTTDTGEPAEVPARISAKEAAESAVKQGMSLEEARGGYLSRLTEAALNGDKSVLVQEDMHRQQREGVR